MANQVSGSIRAESSVPGLDHRKRLPSCTALNNENHHYHHHNNNDYEDRGKQSNIEPLFIQHQAIFKDFMWIILLKFFHSTMNLMTLLCSFYKWGFMYKTTLPDSHETIELGLSKTAFTLDTMPYCPASTAWTTSSGRVCKRKKGCWV